MLSMDPRGFPTSLPEFQRVFPDETACEVYLERLRWPNGFVCPKCSWQGEPHRFSKRSSVVLRCRDCHSNISLMADTVMQGSHALLCRWFWGAYLVTTNTPGMSALQFQRQLGITRYETAFQMFHKLRSSMIRPDRDTIGGQYPVEVDETYVGGRTRGEGRGVHHKATVVGSVEVRRRRDDEDRVARGRREHDGGKPLKRPTYGGRLRLRVAPDRQGHTLEKFVVESVTRGSEVRTDGWQGYDNLVNIGYRHQPIVMDGDPERAEEHLPMIHLVFSNLKTWLRGTHHGVSQRHLQAYLNEYVFRFNRRFYPTTAFNSVLGLAAHSVAPTYDALYSGAWVHPNQ